MKLNKLVSIGLLLSVTSLGSSLLAREVVFDASKVNLSATSSAAGDVVSYSGDRYTLKTNLIECDGYNAKCYPYANKLGLLEIHLKQPMENFTVNHTIKKPRNNNKTDMIIADEFGEAVVLTIVSTYHYMTVYFGNKSYDQNRGVDDQVDIKLVGQKNKVTLYLNGIEQASMKTTLSNLKTIKENFYGVDEKVDADKLERLLIVNDGL